MKIGDKLRCINSNLSDLFGKFFVMYSVHNPHYQTINIELDNGVISCNHQKDDFEVYNGKPMLPTDTKVFKVKIKSNSLVTIDITEFNLITETNDNLYLSDVKTQERTRISKSDLSVLSSWSHWYTQEASFEMTLIADSTRDAKKKAVGLAMERLQNIGSTIVKHYGKLAEVL